MQFKQFARTKYLDTYMQKANNEQNSKILLKKKRLNWNLFYPDEQK